MNIKFLVMDVDGTLTDGKIYMADSGEAMKIFNIKDGYGLHDIAMQKGITPIVITGRTSQIVENRCNELGITELYQGVHDKLGKLKSIVEDLSDVAYAGDDLNDLECMKAVKAAGGIVGCPADAVEEVVTLADFVSTKNGGDGVIRELIVWIINNQ